MNIDKDQDLEEYKQTTNECMQILAVFYIILANFLPLDK